MASAKPKIDVNVCSLILPSLSCANLELKKWLNASANTSSFPGLCQISSSKLNLAAKSLSCLVQAHKKVSLHFPVSNTCCKVALSVFI